MVANGYDGLGRWVERGIGTEARRKLLCGRTQVRAGIQPGNPGQAIRSQPDDRTCGAASGPALIDWPASDF